MGELSSGAWRRESLKKLWVVFLEEFVGVFKGRGVLDEGTVILLDEVFVSS